MRWTCVILVPFAAIPTLADTQEFEDKLLWEIAIAGHYTTLTFAEFPPPPPITLILNQYAPYGAVFTDGQDPVQTTSGFLNDGVGVHGQGSITIAFNEPINWISAEFQGIVQFDLYYEGTLVHTSKLFGGGGLGFFGGVITSEPFDRAVLYRPNPPFDSSPSVDDVHFGPSTAAADLTHDAVVGPADLGELLSQWGPCAPDIPCSADFNDDGLVTAADLAQLLAAWSEDCNANGEFDHFEIITAGDCNDSGLPDGCDITQGSSLDCNANGIPDECELEVLQPMYVLDDGDNDTQIAINGPVPFVWLNGFTVEKGGEVIDRVLAAWGVGPATVAVWSDPNDDGVPHDAVLETVLENVPLTFPIGGPFRTIEIPPTYVGEAGEKFFVGLMLQHEEGEFPAWLDLDSTEPMQSWFWIDLDLDGAIPQEEAFPGHWLIRAASTFNNDANANSVPDDCR